ncbi:MAG TPA: VWA domain-containing protein [Myxococcota bacterium]|nr:VWA domain-containing protein [Myxococcota bacterium]
MRSPGAAALFLAVVLALCTASARAADAPPEITLSLDTVDVVQAPSGGQGLGFLSGKAFAHQGPIELFDVVFVIDTSGSTADSSGLGSSSGWLSHLPGVKVSRADSVLGAEVSAIESLLDGFDPRVTRVGIVAFAGDESPYSAHAWVDAPLTSNFQEIRNALSERMLVDPEGGTDLAAGLLRGAIELLGSRSAESQPRANTTKNLVVLTDGMPNLPVRDPVGAAERAAHSLQNRDIRVHVFAIGREANGAGRQIQPVAEVTHGEYHVVEDLSKLAPLLAQVKFTSLREMRVVNKTTGAPASQLTRDTDGVWSALVPFNPGPNELEVVAVASDGREKVVSRTVVFGDLILDTDQRARRDRLLALQAQTDAHEKAARDKKLAISADGTKPDAAKPPVSAPPP